MLYDIHTEQSVPQKFNFSIIPEKSNISDSSGGPKPYPIISGSKISVGPPMQPMDRTLHVYTPVGYVVLRNLHECCVVVTLSFNDKMYMANFECNLKTRDSQKWPRKGDLSLWERRGSGPETR